MKKISIIVAIAKNYAIGKDNDLLWHISNDMKWFKKHTSGHQVIMGKKTWESLPIKPLPKRTNVVITDVAGESFEGCKMAYSIEEALEYCNEVEESFIIGGGSIYAQFLPHATKLYLTKVHKDFDADIFFPEINFEDWKLIEQEDHDDDPQNDFSYSFLIYERK
jgi:dihydrofolate reductase